MMAPFTGEESRVRTDNKDHANVLLQRMHESKDKFNDFVLIVEQERFPVHKIIMAAASDFIGALLNSDMKEQHDGEVTLDTLDVVGVTAAVNFIYSGKLTMDDVTKNSVIKAASFLQIPTMIDAIIAVFREQLSVDNCFEQLTIIDLYNLDQRYIISISEFIADNFTSIPAEHIHAFSREAMVSFLTNNKLKVASELELVDIIQAWMLFHKKVDIFEPQEVVNVADEPWVSFRSLMTCVRWSLIQPTDLCDKLNTGVQNIMSQILECTSWLLKANVYHNFVKRQPMLQDSHSQVRGEKGLCVLWGNGNIGMIDIEDFYEHEHQTLPKLPQWNDAYKHIPIPMYYIMVASENDFLYVVCGYDKTVDSYSFSRFDPRFDTWCQLTRMNHTPKNPLFYLAFHHNNKVYITHAPAVDVLSECYNVETNEWMTMDAMPVEAGCIMYAGCLARSSASIYVSGGKVDTDNGRTSKDSMCRYDTLTGKWNECAAMMVSRSGHAMENIGDFLYVFGGDHIIANVSEGEREFVWVIEIYSIATDQWTTSDTELATPVLWANTYTMDKGIYIVGGYTRMGGSDPSLSTNIIQYFTDSTPQLDITKRLPQRIYESEEICKSCLLTTSAYNAVDWDD